jgi:RNA polymerase sigma-70 factor (ECF subfamily)
VTTARNKALDRVRREGRRLEKELASLVEPHEEEVGAVRDDQLRLLFTCCHPALSLEARVALTLKLLGGLTTPEIARAFLVPETTMAQRLTRAKAKIRDAGIPYRVPQDQDLPARVTGVLAVVYLVFNEGWEGREDLCAEAVRLARLLVELMPDEPEALGLLALLLLLPRHRGQQVEEGRALLRQCLRRDRPGPYQLQAAIAAVHAEDGPTDWAQVVALYDQLITVLPTPVVALNRAVAVAELHGPRAGWEVISGLDLPGYAPLDVVREELARRLEAGER